VCFSVSRFMGGTLTASQELRETEEAQCCRQLGIVIRHRLNCSLLRREHKNQNTQRGSEAVLNMARLGSVKNQTGSGLSD
jgi:hypothetical protein